MNYFYCCILVLLILSVVVLSMVSMPYRGVVALMGASFLCCVLMVFLGRTFAALVMYIVYLGGLVVVFGYCVSVEKDLLSYFEAGGVKYFIIFMFVLIMVLLFGDGGELLVYSGWEDLVCLEVNGGGVFYFKGGGGLIVCSWGLLVVLFSILVVLGWSRLGCLRSF